MHIEKFKAMDRAGRKEVLQEMHKERIRLEGIRTPEEMEPLLDEIHRFEEEHERAKNPEYIPVPRRRPKPTSPPTSWAVLLED